MHVDGDLHVDGHHTVEDVGISGGSHKSVFGWLKALHVMHRGHFHWMIRYAILPLILVVVHFIDRCITGSTGWRLSN